MSEEPNEDQTDLSASPPLPYVPTPSLSLCDLTGHEPQDKLGHSDVTESLTNPGEEAEGQQGSSGFKFDERDDKVEDLSGPTMEPNTQKDQGEREQCDIDQGMSKSNC